MESVKDTGKDRKVVEKPTSGKRYWTFYKHPDSGYTQVLEATWTNSYIDEQRYSRGVIYGKKKEAQKASEDV